MTLPEAYQSQVQHIQPSPKFQPQANGDMQPTAFPGYSIITPPWADDRSNSAFYQHLQRYQQQTVQALEPGLIVPVPPESFHMTIADLIWENTYLHAAQDPSFDSKLQTCIAQSFNKAQYATQGEKPIQWQIIGLFLRTRAIAICLAPREEAAYDRIVTLRRTIYQNPDLIALGIDQQYNLTAHITLGYFTEIVATADRDRLYQALNQLNQHWLETDTNDDFTIDRVELRKFDNMVHYYREPNWAALEF